MENSRLAQVTAAFKDLMGRMPSSTELKTYLSARGDVESLIAQTSEYAIRVKGRIDQVHRSLLGTSVGDSGCNAFISYCRDSGVKPHACERSVIRDFVSTTPEFLDKYTAMVEEVYRIEVGGTPDLRTKASLAMRFKDEEFSPSDLAEAIRAGATPTVDCIEGSGDAMVVHKAVERIGAELDFVERWQRTTGRRVDIYEFLRYYNDLGSSPTPDAIREIQSSQDQAYARASKVYREYLGVSLDFDRFTALHVHEYDVDGFVEKLVAKIVRSNEYRERMCETLSKAYTRTFDSEIHDDDLSHAFESVREKALSLTSEEISGTIFALGEELKMIAESVGEVYARVLRRSPDALEVRNAVSSYRESEEAEASLEDSLYDEPEYQEVLKRLIQDATGYTKNADVFRVMRKVLAECGGDMRTAHDHICSD